MCEPRLHLDADTSNRAVHAALLTRGHDVTRTPETWMPLDASDEMQLLGATAHGRVIFTFSVHDFVVLAARYPHHHGIILAAQSSWTLSGVIEALDLALRETKIDDWGGHVCWLNGWRT